MKTEFSDAQLADPAIQRSNKILRSCVHCGFCTATCPTYQVLGDERVLRHARPKPNVLP